MAPTLASAPLGALSFTLHPVMIARDPLRRLGIRIDGGDVLLPDIIHGAVHRTHREFSEVEQQILVER